MGFLNPIFESVWFRTLKAYVLFLTFLNIPYLLLSLLDKGKILLSAVCEGSSLMFSIQVSLLKWLINWAGAFFGNEALFSSIEKWLANLVAKNNVSAIILIIGVILAIVIIHFGIRIIGRIIPAVANLHEQRRPKLWFVLYPVLFVIYLYVSIIG